MSPRQIISKLQGPKAKILLGRVLTISGDQAWGFAVPIVLLRIFPERLQIAALYYLLIRFAHVALFPSVALLIDRLPRMKTAKIGIFMQAGAIGAGAVFVTIMRSESSLSSVSGLLTFGALVTSGIVSSIGGSLMDIAISNDIVPEAIGSKGLTDFNSRLRQLDLATEVLSPVITGLVLLIRPPSFDLLGFWIIAIWNLVSFFPELLILRSIFRSAPRLHLKTTVVDPSVRESIWVKVSFGWRELLREPIRLVILAYAALWLSALSPHGVLMTGFLKGGWNLSEAVIGVFRGLGAVFGLAATFIFPVTIKRFGLRKGTHFFLLFQCSTVIVALFFFMRDGELAKLGFLLFVLLSRIGVYGFTLGEMQIRQLAIHPSRRGMINGVANALNRLAALGLYACGALLPSTQDFGILVAGSAAAVVIAVVLYGRWMGRAFTVIGDGASS